MSNITAQEEFDKKYITSTEICENLEITRPAIHFRRKAGKLPDCIKVHGQQLLIWERDKITPFLKEWEYAISSSRRRRSGEPIRDLRPELNEFMSKKDRSVSE